MVQELAQQKTDRIVAIDYLKGAAAIIVIITHALTKKQRLKIAGPFWISMAVPIFMILSGFTNALAADKAGLHSLKELYQKEKLGREMSRILFPYFIIVTLEYLLGFYQLFFLRTGPFLNFTFKNYLVYFLTGGIKPGSYYIPILLQFILLFPLLYYFYQRFPKLTFSTIFLVHFLFDFSANYLPIPTKVYRLLIFRYLGFVMLGLALYFSYFRVKKLVKGTVFLSLLYIFMYSFGYRLKVFAKWPNTALPTVFWAGALVIVAFEHLNKAPTNWLSFLLSKIGKASYSIFLVQKILFGFGLNRFLKLLIANRIIHTLVAIIIGCAIGLLFEKIVNHFYKVERRVK